jgi:K+-transporting ATPase ATPase C chain
VVVITILTGFLFPGLITLIAQVAFARQANGSLIYQNGKPIGSELIGQPFTSAGYFQPRPSAAGNGYNAGKPDDSYAGSGATNLGPTSDKLINGIHKKLADGKTDDPNNFDGIKDLAVEYRQTNGLAKDAPVPADAVTRSASGLDPEISPANADLQVARVAKARGISEDQVRQLISANTSGATLGFMGDDRVNVLLLNLALDKAAPLKPATVAASPAASPAP